MTQVPLHIAMMFIAVVFSMAFLLMIGVLYAGRKLELPLATRRRNLLLSLLLNTTWLTVTLLAAVSGWLQPGQEMPPHLLLLLIPPVIAIGYSVTSAKVMAYATALPAFWWIYVQSFRVLIEAILWMLYRYNLVPVQMTFEGYNFDVLTALTAPVVAYYCFVKNTWPKWIAVAWNLLGLGTLLTIVAISVLSSPLPFRYFTNQPANTVVFNFPMVWLPTFIVPVALGFHLMSLKLLLQKPAANP